MINAEAKEKINLIIKKIHAGENFSDLAKQFSEDEVQKNQEVLWVNSILIAPFLKFLLK